MKRFFWMLLVFFTLGAAVFAEEFPSAGTPFNGGIMYTFLLDGHEAKVCVPANFQEGKPWLFRTVYWRAFAASEDVMFQKGWAVAWIQTPNRCATPEDNAIRTSLYTYLTEKQGFNAKPVVFGMSYGGLSALRWAAANPEKVRGLYVDAPVCNFQSWKNSHPEAWEIILRDYGMTEAELLTGDGNPVVGIHFLAEKGIPMLLICGDADKTVPYSEHGKILGENFRKAGGNITEIVKPGCDHHPHGLTDVTPIVTFYENCWKN